MLQSMGSQRVRHNQATELFSLRSNVHSDLRSKVKLLGEAQDAYTGMNTARNKEKWVLVLTPLITSGS